MTRDLVAYAADSGRWWLPVLFVVFAVVAVTALVAEFVVPTTVYVLF